MIIGTRLTRGALPCLGERQRNKYRPQGGRMNDTRLVPKARYLLQIFSNGEWKTVAYLNV
jgi:hypothetical protein